MTQPQGIMLATLCLNEMEWLPSLWEQHRDWPELRKWVFVEAADRIYAETNPARVSNVGGSIDGTSDFLRELAAKDDRVTYIPFGISSHSDMAQCKVSARNAYLEVADEIQPKFVYVLDADEFYTKNDQSEVLRMMQKLHSTTDGYVFKQRHAWRPVSISESATLLQYEVIGGYWDVPHVRGWTWRKGMRYLTNHNQPEGFRNIRHLWRNAGMPQCVHTGFASALRWRAAKHRYYEQRGEGVKDKRQMYVDCRAAFETWKLGDTLPHGASIKLWDGPIPECFQQGTSGVEHSLIQVLQVDGGRLSWRFGMAGTIELYDLRVDDDKHRRGIGIGLVMELMRQHPEKTFYGFIREDNRPSIELYRRLNFEILPIPMFYGRGEPSNAVMILSTVDKAENLETDWYPLGEARPTDETPIVSLIKELSCEEMLGSVHREEEK